MKAALYARVSTSDQDPEVQIRELREYVQTRDWVVASEYVDKGVSGVKTKRPKLDELMADARLRRFQAVLVWRFDRFGRSLKHLIQSLEEFRARKISFVSITEGFDTTTPTGELLFHVAGAFAQFERHLIQERVRAGLAHARAKGVRLGRPKLPIDPAKIQTMRGEGLSLQQIAQRLNCSRSSVWRTLRVNHGQSPATETLRQDFGTPSGHSSPSVDPTQADNLLPHGNP